MTEVVVHELTPTDDTGSLPVVLAVHGITANALSWRVLARELTGRARVLAPDLRGRADSRSVAGGYGLGVHADDLVAALDRAGVERAVVVGHSMGAFVAAICAARRPDRVSAALLVDGGVAFPRPAGHHSAGVADGAVDADVDALLQAVIGPAMTRLSMSFETAQDYLDHWSAHPAVGPALAGPTGDDVRAYLLHDLVGGDGGSLRSSCVLEAVRADGAEVLLDPQAHAAVGAALSAGVPVTLLWAARGLMDEPQGLYDTSRLTALELPRDVEVVPVADCNHYSVILDPTAVRCVAAAVLASVAQRAPRRSSSRS